MLRVPMDLIRMQPCSVPLVALFLVVACCAWVLAPGNTSAQSVESDKRVHSQTTPSLLYVSDYFSFVGKDSQGHVAFALDNNRGVDGKKFQAEHFVVLHDAGRGWIEVKGNGAYDNSQGDLLKIPDSPSFRFQGTPETGMSIVSGANHLTLTVG